MTNEIRKKVGEVFNELFPEVLELSDETSSKDIHTWDSLNHIMLISAVEKKFDIKFELHELLTMQSFGGICTSVGQKLNS